jgi:hypothetical protein
LYSYFVYNRLFNDSSGGWFGFVVPKQASITRKSYSFVEAYVVITMPASMGAIIVDSFDKE